MRTKYLKSFFYQNITKYEADRHSSTGCSSIFQKRTFLVTLTSFDSDSPATLVTATFNVKTQISH